MMLIRLLGIQGAKTMVEDANKIINSYIKNQLIENYLNCRQGIIDELRSKELWNTCNTDDTGKYLFFIAPTEYPDFNGGNSNI
ncbi:MAG TPA: hypothetical protein DEV81_18960 [Cyanobacteria bacterium UBA11049]|nr:hypothetical protein [Cyanobacteria bacterium UBA11049]